MAFSTQRVIIVTIFICFLIGLGSTLRLETTPEPLNVFIHKQITITCIGDDPSLSAHDVVLMEIGRQGEMPIAILHNGTGMAPNSNPNIKAEGDIDKGSNNTFVSVTINNPGIGDAGTFICLMVYVDPEFEIKEVAVSADVTLDSQAMKTVSKYLVEKVSALDNQIISQENHVKSHDYQISLMNDALTNINDIIEGQSHQIKTQDDQIFLMSYVIDCLNDTVETHGRHQTNITNAFNTITTIDQNTTAVMSDLQNIVAVMKIRFNKLETQQMEKDQNTTAAMSDLQNTVAVMNGRFNKLETDMTQQMEKDQNTTAAMSDLQNTVVMMKGTFNKLETDVTQQMEKDKKTTAAMSDLQNTVAVMNARFNKLETAMTQQMEKDQDTTAAMSDLQNTVAVMNGRFNKLETDVTQQMDKDQKTTAAMSDLQNTVAAMNGRFNTLETQQMEKDQKTTAVVSDLQNTVAVMNGRFNKLETDVTQQIMEKDLKTAEAMSDLQNTVAVMNGKFNKLETDMTQQMEKDQNTTAAMSDLQNTVAVMNGRFNNYKTHMTQQMEKVTARCYFSAAYNKKDKLEDYKLLLFSRIISSTDNHYNSETGIFTAPYDGIYVFHLMVRTLDDTDSIFIRLSCNYNSNVIAALYAYDYSSVHGDHSSMSTVVYLSQGDRVYPWVRYYSGSNVLKDLQYSMFSGYLLTAV